MKEHPYRIYLFDIFAYKELNDELGIKYSCHIIMNICCCC